MHALSVSHSIALSPFPFSLTVQPQSFPSLKEAVNSNPTKKRTYARQDARATAAAVSTKALRATRYSYNYDSDNSKGLWGGGAEDPTEDSTRQSTAWGWLDRTIEASVGSVVRWSEGCNSNCDMKPAINGKSKRSPCSFYSSLLPNLVLLEIGIPTHTYSVPESESCMVMESVLFTMSMYAL